MMSRRITLQQTYQLSLGQTSRNRWLARQQFHAHGLHARCAGEQALYNRQPERSDTLIHHSDRGSQYVCIRHSERLAEAGIEPSIGSGDDTLNALG